LGSGPLNAAASPTASKEIKQRSKNAPDERNAAMHSRRRRPGIAFVIAATLSMSTAASILPCQARNIPPHAPTETGYPPDLVNRPLCGTVDVIDWPPCEWHEQPRAGSQRLFK
jgi:hypothetical protein